jgi:serine/threonine-protein kinase
MPNPTSGGPSEIEQRDLTAPAQEPARDEMIGRQVGAWRVVKVLGEGGMGAVYMGEHPGIGSKVAIKMLHRRFDADEVCAVCSVLLPRDQGRSGASRS